MPNDLVYGKTYNIQNGYNNFAGGFLDTRDMGCDGNYLCVSTASGRDRDNGSGTWQIQSTTGKQGSVQFGDNVHLLNQWHSDGGYLDTRDMGCDGNYLCVSTASGSDRDSGSGTWQIQSTTGKQGSVQTGDEVYLLNQWHSDGGYLDTRDMGCHGNYLCVSTAHAPNRDNGSGTWRFFEFEVIPE